MHDFRFFVLLVSLKEWYDASLHESRMKMPSRLLQTRGHTAEMMALGGSTEDIRIVLIDVSLGAFTLLLPVVEKIRLE